VSAILPEAERPKALYIAGNPGSGKSSLIQNMALQDIKANRGVCVIDPTGDLVNRIAAWIPKEQAQRLGAGEVIIFDTDDPVPIDFFSYRSPAERELLTDQLLDIFNLENAPVSKPRLQRIIGTLFDANESKRMNLEENAGDRCTFLDILHFIEDKTRRETILSYCGPERHKQWNPMPGTGKDYASIYERMGPFLESRTLRAMFECRSPRLNISDVMAKNQILLVNLKDTATDFFIGSLIMSKIQQATFARRSVPEATRVPYYLYVDECQTVMAYSEKKFADILTRARKYKLCLTMSNQIPVDLPSGIRSKLGTIASKILFNLDAENARIFKDAIAPCEVYELMNLRDFHAISRINRRVRHLKTPTFLGPSPASYATIMRNRTVDRYACNSPQVRQDEGNDHPNTDAEPQEQKPSSRPVVVPSHKTHKANPRNTR